MTTLYKFRTTVSKVEFKKQTVSAYKEGDQTIVREQDLGWFILLLGSLEWLHIGWEKPDLESGDQVEVMIRRTSGA